ncbi:GNAT family N-acetyltransferase [Marinagarivorans algicola]|uniref:GNAT family N-acetyltransferase n=1 Tax=Marinagarivorans algicola TaxID=1513270 RepID=UPI0006B49230|nr:GNAT family N-acetyltransferase [Marinagarivorans algicola]
MRLTQVLPPTACDFETLKYGLTQYNESFTGTVFREKIAAFVKDDKDVVVGGVLGEIHWNWLHIQGLWLDESIRKEGWGTKLLAHVERYAVSKNTLNIRLETTSFQALDFYIKLGYAVFGELPNMPQGYTSYFLQKTLSVTAK